MVTRVLVSLALLLWSFGSCIARAADAELRGVAPAARTAYTAVIVWHDIVAGPKEVWFDTSLETFRAQLAAIERGGFHVVSLDVLRAHLERGTPLPPRALVLTFDDNGHGLYDNAFAELRKHRFPATLFVHSNFVGITTSKRHTTWPQLTEMVRSGLISVQSLTANHPPDLRSLTDPAIAHELTLSRYSLEHRLGKPVYALVYPEDNYDARTERLASANRYALAFIEDFGSAEESHNLLEIHRYSALTRFDQALADVAAHH